MARPRLTHAGFLIPNAATVSNPRMAEPDQVDFSTLAHTTWGVIDGCEVVVSDTTASTVGGTALVNGVLVTVPPGSVDLGTSTGDRFHLVTVDIGGNLTKESGTPSDDPVFPDPPLDKTVLAAVFAPAGISDLASNVIDKRKFVPKSLLTKLPPADTLIRNVNGSGNHFFVRGDGRTEWAGDTFMYRAGVRTLKIEDHLQLAGNLSLGGGITTVGDIIAQGKVCGSNICTGDTLPSTANDGMIFSTPAGKLYIRRGGQWRELVTADAAVPVGSLIQSLETPNVMRERGWYPLNGTQVTEGTGADTLFALPALQPYITGTAPTRTLTLPNMEMRAMHTSWAKPPLALTGKDKVALALTNMPPHKHNVSSAWGGGASPKVTIGRAGAHSHKTTKSGAHSHQVADPGHAHHLGGADREGLPTGAFVCLAWGGKNKVDALFNDRNHTYSVESAEWTNPSQTGVQIQSTADSEHVHAVEPDGDHNHVATIEAIAEHQHAVTEHEVGGGEPFDITPQGFTVYTYIKA